MIEQLIEGFFLVGFSIIVSLFYLSKKSKKIEGNISDLISFNDVNNQDALIYLEKTWPFFQKAGFVGYKCDLTWFGTKSTFRYGVVSEHAYRFKQKLELISVSVTAYTSKSKAEKQHFEHIFWQNFVLMLKMDLLIKVNAIHSAEQQLQKYNTFMLHDMKNIAQLIVMVDDSMAKKPKANAEKMIAMLESVIPSIRIRSERIIQMLTKKDAKEQDTPFADVVLENKIQEIAAIHNVKIKIEGGAVVLSNEEILDQVLDNLINNYLHHTDHKKIINIKIENEDKNIYIRFHGTTVVENYNRVRLFEPFWSSSEHGMGVGLHQCKILLKKLSADLEVNYLEDKTLEFVMHFKKND